MSAEHGEVARDHDWIMAQAETFKAMGETEPRAARDAVNQPMINNWTEAVGDHDPRWTQGVAPPAMAQVWTMYGLDSARPAQDPLHGTMQMLDAAGFTSVLGTNCDQTYARFVREGETVSITTRLDSVVGPKKTGVGEGYFVTTINTWWVGEGEDREPVATMLFRVLKFKPGARAPKVDKSQTIRPSRNRDTEFFWEGTAAGELRISKCNSCGELRHPPGPMCPVCHAADRGYVVAQGTGTVFSHLTHHAPQLPGKELPLQLALVELPEGVRMVGEIVGEPAEIGDRVETSFEKLDEDTTLVMWRKC